ncbi:hypothetical protein [Marinomonas ostreistagni]|uniref:hypothetical protein n=1 Tax=Marinomonas ostreistagni TaxID=359209 RepID=UPI0019522A46|nr:hypothetical protein [Marinomonas ostreistagni]MBM6549551.1 hypothetical protein [Marinomonas ostreistagni]
MSKLLATLTPKTQKSQLWLNVAFVTLILSIAALGFIADGYLDSPNKNFLLVLER